MRVYTIHVLVIPELHVGCLASKQMRTHFVQQTEYNFFRNDAHCTIPSFVENSIARHENEAYGAIWSADFF